MIAVELIKKIVIEVDATTHAQATALALASDASSEHQSAWDHAQAEAPVGNQPSPQFCRDVRCTAYEGGSNYWAESRNVERSADGEYLSFSLRSHEDADDEKLGKWTRIDDEAVRAACARIVNELGLTGNAHIQLSAASTVEGWDAGQVDAEAADAIMQIACFGELVYG